MAHELVTVATYPQAMLAHAARNFLADAGIRAFVADEFTTDQSWSNFIEANLQVAAADAEQAKALLAGADDRGAREEPDVAEDRGEL